MTAGYSGTPLAKKLGIKPGSRVYAENAPADYLTLLEPLPDAVIFSDSPDPDTDVVHVFTTKRNDLKDSLKRYLATLRKDAVIWVSWPKKASRVPTDITEDVIREVALPLGLVDVKVCAVDETWSGLKLVLRKENR